MSEGNGGDGRSDETGEFLGLVCAHAEMLEQLELLLAVCAVKYGGGKMEITVDDIRSTVGMSYEIFSPPSGGCVVVVGGSPQDALEKALPAATHQAPEGLQ